MRTVFSLGMLSQALKDLRSGQTVGIDGDTLGMLFPPGEAGITNDKTRSAAHKFALDHKCKFFFNEQTGRSSFSKE